VYWSRYSPFVGIVEVLGEIEAAVLLAEEVVAVLVMDTPKGIVEGGIEGAGGDEFREGGHHFGEL
jgi:hypothetical protein